MTDTAHATPGPLPPPPPRRSHGCLWGCLAAALIAIVAIVGVVSYTGWYFYNGFKNDPTLHAVMHVVGGDQVARAVLGDNIQITNIESSSFNAELGNGKTATYIAHLKGSKGEGTLTVTVQTPTGGSAHITVLTLVGPDGHKYDLNDTGGGGAATPAPTDPAQPTTPTDSTTPPDQDGSSTSQGQNH